MTKPGLVGENEKLQWRILNNTANCPLRHKKSEAEIVKIKIKKQSKTKQICNTPRLVYFGSVKHKSFLGALT